MGSAGSKSVGFTSGLLVHADCRKRYGRPAPDCRRCIKSSRRLAEWLLHQQNEAEHKEFPEIFERLINDPKAILLTRFFITKKGYMGMGRFAEPGDEVCILFGGQAPFLLRETEGVLELIENCYVNGLISEEAMEEYEEFSHVKTTFRIS